jgi:hypothetical protein
VGQDESEVTRFPPALRDLLATLGTEAFENREMVRTGAGVCLNIHRGVLDDWAKDLMRKVIVAGILTHRIEGARSVPR